VLCDVRSLRELVLAGNLLEALPGRLGDLSELEMLVIRGNKIVSLPESVSRLSKLQYLYAGDNALTELPEALCACASLLEIVVNGNMIERVAEGVADLPSLALCDVSHNRITVLPPRLVRLWREHIPEEIVEAVGGSSSEEVCGAVVRLEGNPVAAPPQGLLSATSFSQPLIAQIQSGKG
jgi:hypothetical protein